MSADYHVHTAFSGDSDTPMEAMAETALKLKLSSLCFTEHMDLDFPGGDTSFHVDTQAYYKKYLSLQECFAEQIELQFGIELGLQPQLAEIHTKYLRSWPFDFVIGSSHVVHHKDPYYPDYYDGRTEREAYLEYFESILENLHAFSEMDVYGHIDYVVRYGPNKNKAYSYSAYQEVLDEILRTLIDKGIGLEMNMGGFKYGLGHPNPTEEILKRYRELGGELITVGSDAHRPCDLAYDFHKVRELLSEAGFSYYTVFRKRKPYFLPLETF